LSWVQTRGLLVGLAAFCLVAGAVLAVQFVVLWPVATLCVGVLCGATVFLDEQGGAFRFLGDQRFPLTRLWLTKLGMRLAVACLAALLLCLPAAFMLIVQDGPPKTNPAVFGNYWLALAVSPLPFAVAWLAHGFAAGHLCGLLFRKPVVALAVAVGLAALLVTVWVPSILLGGLHVWQALSVPLVLLVCARLILPAWAADRLASWCTALRLVVAGLFCVALIALGLWVRVAEVPDVPVPDDLPAFVERLDAQQNNKTGQIVRTFCDQLRDQERLWPAVKPAAPVLPGKPVAAGNDYLVQCRAVIGAGWPGDNHALGKWLDDVFGQPLWRDLDRIKALPTGVLDDPRRLTVASDLPYVNVARKAGLLLAVRGLQMQKVHGRPEVFLDNLETALALVRTLENQALSWPASAARAIEAEQLTALEPWLEQSGSHPVLLRRALTVLAQHRDQVPDSFHQHRLADYLVALASLNHPEDWLPIATGRQPLRDADNTELAVLATLGQIPWERQRQERLVRLVYWDSESRDKALPLRTLWPLVSSAIASHAETPSRRQCRLSAAVLTLALRLYEAEKRQPAKTLAALVPAYLPAVPPDPFDGEPFRYRLSRGEEIFWPTDGSTHQVGVVGPGGPNVAPMRKVAPGQAVLWSVGEDRHDDGGVRRCRPQRRCEAGEDIIFLVPRPVKK
jgi:hypothetical protein